jgi:hypothetical protein
VQTGVGQRLMLRKTSYFDQTCNEFISDWVVMACLGPKPIKVLLRTNFQDGNDKPQKCRSVCFHPTHQWQRRPSTLPSSRMHESPNLSGARLAVRSRLRLLYYLQNWLQSLLQRLQRQLKWPNSVKINNTAECHQYKPNTDVIKAAKKDCTSYLNQCASG